MGDNGKDEIMVEASQCASAMVEIKIKTLDSQMYTLRVDKCVRQTSLISVLTLCFSSHAFVA